MFNIFSPTGLPGFRVKPQDEVPGFDIDENGVPRRERSWFDAMRPGSATPQDPASAQALTPAQGPEGLIQPTPPPPDWLYQPMIMPLPALPGPFAPPSGPRPAPYGTLFNPVGSYQTPDRNMREMGDARLDVPGITPPPAPSAVEGPGAEQWLSFDAPKPLADIDAPYGTATAQNFNPQPTWQEAMESRWPLPSDDGPPSEKGNVASPQDLPASGMAQQATGASPAPPSVGPAADPNFVLANADGDEVQEAQQTQQPGRNTPTPVPQRGRPSAGTQPAAPLREKSGEELTRLAESRREEALKEAWKEIRSEARREERAPYWDYILRALPVPDRLPTLKSQALPNDRFQKPLSPDWREDVRKINPGYLDHTEAAAKKHGIPPELLARLLYRESNFKNEGVDSNGSRLRNRAVGIPQMYPDALKDVGVDPETFGRAGAAAQIDAGAAYLAKQYRTFGDWPRAVAAYHFGAGRIEAWLSGKGPTYEYITQRKNEESENFRGRTEKYKKSGKESVEDREAEAAKRAEDEMKQWAELQGYLPHIFLGDPSRYDRARSP